MEVVTLHQMYLICIPPPDLYRYAMKTIFSEHQHEMNKSLHEVMIMRRYRHPYIVDVHDAFQITLPKSLYIVMSYCEGKNFSFVIHGGELSLTDMV